MEHSRHVRLAYVEDDRLKAGRIAGAVGLTVRMRESGSGPGFKLLYRGRTIAGANFELTLRDVERLCSDFVFLTESISLQNT